MIAKIARCGIVVAEQAEKRVVILDAGADWSRPEAVLWQWESRKAPDLSEKQRRWFDNISECKIYGGGDKVLTAASGGGVALIDIATKKLEFLGYAGGNTHSAEVLPDGNIVAASSDGNKLTLFTRDEKKLEPLAKTAIPLKDAHGCVWDKKRQILWAVHYFGIVAYKYNGRKDSPALQELGRHPLPPVEGEPLSPMVKFWAEKHPGGPLPIGGHDLYPLADEDALLMTCWGGAWCFDPETHKFSRLSDVRNIKSLSRHPADGDPRFAGKFVYQVPTEKWWTDTVSEIGGTPRVFPGAKIYKVRWCSRNRFSY